MTLYTVTDSDCRSLDSGLRWQAGQWVESPEGERGMRGFYRDPDLALLMCPSLGHAPYGQEMETYRRDVRLWEVEGEVGSDLSSEVCCRTATLTRELPLPQWRDGSALELRVRVRFALLAAAQARPSAGAARSAVLGYWDGLSGAIERVLTALRGPQTGEAAAAAKAAATEAAHWARIAGAAPEAVENEVLHAVTAAGEVVAIGHASGAAHYELTEAAAAHWGAAKAASAAADGAEAAVATRAAGAANMAVFWAQTWGWASIDLVALARQAVAMEMGEA